MEKRILSLTLVLSMLTSFAPMLTVSAASIDVGNYVQMGTYYGEPILWRCVDIDDNGPLMLADKIICLKAFDARTSSNTTTGSHTRRDYTEDEADGSHYDVYFPSNYWGDSNMRSWLNSSASAGNVEWLCGNPPDSDHMWSGYNEYDQEAGFMTNFTTGELNAVKEVTQKSLVAYPEYDNGIYTMGSEAHDYSYYIDSVVQNYDTAYAENITDKFFLLDVKQVNAVYNNSGVLGEDYYIGEPTEQCVANSEYIGEGDLEAGKKWYYWLRSPADGKNFVRFVYSSGVVSVNEAYDGGGGVRPAFYLADSAAFSSGDGAESSPYIVETGETPTPAPVKTPAPTPSPTPAPEPCFTVTDGTVTNTAGTEQTAAVIIAAYDADGALTSVTAETVTFGADEEKTFTVPRDGKIFVWNSLGGMVPLNK